MSSPITFSGFNNIDFNSILNSIITAERVPMTTLQSQKTALNTQGTAYTTLAGKLGAVRSALDALTDSKGLTTTTATSGDSNAVSVSATAGGIAGLYEVVVSELAHAQVMASTTTYTGPDEVIATDGTISVALFGNPSVQIPPNPFSGSVTLRQLADAINAQGDSAVNAALVQAARGQYRLVLTGRNTGSANAFTVTTSLSGGTGVAFTDTDGDGTFGDNAADLAVQATDAALTVNNVPITGASNTVEEAIPGVSMTLSKKDATKTVLVEVSQNSSGAKQQLDAFVTAYNDLMSFLNSQRNDAVSGKPNIAKDGIVRSLSSALRMALQAEYGDNVNLSRLSTVGLEFDRTGTMKLNAARLSTALASSYNDVRTLFDHAFGEVTSRIDAFVQSKGLIQSAKDRLKDQIVKIDSRLDAMQLQLDLRRAALQQEFTAADLAMTQLKSRSSSLQALGGQYRLF